jgi:hypothetical protein
MHRDCSGGIVLAERMDVRIEKAFTGEEKLAALREI